MSHKMLKIHLRSKLLRAVFIGWIVIFGSACSQLTPRQTPLEAANATETQAIPVSPTEGDTTPVSQSLPTPADPILQTLIEKARTDLAQRLSVPGTEIVLLQATSVTWPDGSLGCPQQGMEYAQVLTPGYLIRLRSGDREFEYHASKGTFVTYCENPSPPILDTPENT
jgi:hypothetical protein